MALLPHKLNPTGHIECSSKCVGFNSHVLLKKKPQNNVGKEWPCQNKHVEGDWTNFLSGVISSLPVEAAGSSVLLLQRAPVCLLKPVWSRKEPLLSSLCSSLMKTPC